MTVDELVRGHQWFLRRPIARRGRRTMAIIFVVMVGIIAYFKNGFAAVGFAAPMAYVLYLFSPFHQVRRIRKQFTKQPYPFPNCTWDFDDNQLKLDRGAIQASFQWDAIQRQLPNDL